jgi:hypothetical protein
MGHSLSKADIAQLAAKHDVSAATVEALAAAITHSGGRAAQFNIPELGGMGQWMPGGMLMIGDMFNHQLKAVVDALCRDVAAAVHNAPPPSSSSPVGVTSRTSWWPSELGVPASAGSQNAMRYAIFPQRKRLVIDDNGSIATYDTGEHVLTGVSQQQSDRQHLTFSSAAGPVPLTKLKRIE